LARLRNQTENLGITISNKTPGLPIVIDRRATAARHPVDLVETDKG
jgi:hypothetical protein